MSVMKLKWLLEDRDVSKLFCKDRDGDKIVPGYALHVLKSSMHGSPMQELKQNFSDRCFLRPDWYVQ